MSTQIQHDLIETNGIKLHIASQGDPANPLVILLHGFPEHWYSWHKQLPVLAQAGYYAVAPDMRGYNLSDKPKGVAAYTISELTADVAGLIRALGREQAVVVGHDWGGGVAWAFAMRYPQMTEKLIVLNCPHPMALAREFRTLNQLRKSWYMFFFQIPALPEAIILSDPHRFARTAFQDSTLRKDAFSDDDIRRMAEAMQRPGALQAGINYYRAFFRSGPSEARNVQRLEMPVLLIWGMQDFALRREATYGLEQWVSNLVLHYVPNCGHWVQNEAPEEVNQTMIEFLKDSA